MMPLAINSGSSHWWEIVGALGPFAILLAAGIAATVAGMSLRQKSIADQLALAQKSAADSRSEWWRRAQWALDTAMSADTVQRALGNAILSVLAGSELASAEELAIFDIAWKSVPRVANAGEPPHRVDYADHGDDNGVEADDKADEPEDEK